MSFGKEIDIIQKFEKKYAKIELMICTTYGNFLYLCNRKRKHKTKNVIIMKRIILLSLMALMTIASFGRKRVENVTVVADTIFYAENMSNVASAEQASYYRLLMTTGTGLNKQDVFKDYYVDGNLRAEGGYTFIDLGNDRNTIFNGEVTTYYKNGKEKWHGKYVNGKREGYFTLQLREGGVAVVQFKNGKSVHDFFTVTYKDGTMEKKPLSDIRSLM